MRVFRSFPFRCRCAALLLGFICGGPHGQSSLTSLPALTGDGDPVTPQSLVQAIDDPSTGAHWLLVRDTSHPGGPGKLLRSPTPHDRGPGILRRSTPDLVVRAGDTLLVDAHTAHADVYLEAVALSPARLGFPLRVRLKVGGRIVCALASGPGRATLSLPPEGWQP